jgi:hypothetical protein
MHFFGAALLSGLIAAIEAPLLDNNEDSKGARAESTAQKQGYTRIAKGLFI